MLVKPASVIGNNSCTTAKSEGNIDQRYFLCFLKQLNMTLYNSGNFSLASRVSATQKFEILLAFCLLLLVLFCGIRKTAQRI